LIELFVFSYNQLGRISPMLIVWLGLYYWNKKSAGRQEAFSPQSYAQELSKWDRSFLLWVGLTPFIATVLAAAILQVELVTSWATTFFILYGFYAFWWLSGNEHVNLRRTIVAVILIHALLALGYAIARGPLAYYAGRNARSTFPGAIVSAEMNKVWLSHVADIPLRLVASDRWLGGNIAIHTDPKTNVFIDARYNESPWLNPETALDCGVLIAYSETTLGAPVPEITALLDRAVWKGVTNVPWSTPNSPTIVINWGIIPPGLGCHLLSNSKNLTKK
jgi:hypothetical protein